MPNTNTVKYGIMHVLEWQQGRLVPQTLTELCTQFNINAADVDQQYRLRPTTNNEYKFKMAWDVGVRLTAARPDFFHGPYDEVVAAWPFP